MIQVLTSVKFVNKTDAVTLITTFGSLKNLIQANEYQLLSITGFGEKKAKKLFITLHENFLK